ncbi:hypothetical protein ACQZET_08520 [Corynebacterium diphtheriae]|uniref:hypothetical protein n=1 Tax=Corynebacterium diphtheriae TaxID=1717 RepID=UPI004041ECC3
MSKETDWFSEMAKRRVTVTEIAEYLGISRRTATNRVNDGLTADDLIAVSRALGLSPIHALVELGKITYQEAFDFVEGEGKLLATATTEELIVQLARDNLSLSQLIDLGNDGRDRLARAEESKRVRTHLRAVSTPDDSFHDDGTVMEWDDSIPHAADSSPDEQAEREKRGEDLID